MIPTLAMLGLMVLRSSRGALEGLWLRFRFQGVGLRAYVHGLIAVSRGPRGKRGATG